MTTAGTLRDPYELVAQALGRQPGSITLDSAMYRDHGWDSLGHVGIITALEEAYGSAIADADIGKFITMKAIVEYYEHVKEAKRAT